MKIKQEKTIGVEVSVITLKSGVCLEIVGDSEILTVLDKSGKEMLVLNKDGFSVSHEN